MKRALIAGLTVVFVVAQGAAAVEAKGCLKGAAVGAIAGHYAHHHAVLGAIAGCAIGHHLAIKKERDEQAARAHPIPSAHH